MKRTVSLLLSGTFIIAAILVSALQARAELGGSVDSITSDSKALSAVRSATTAGRTYTVHEITSDANTVREYASPDGIVFAIAWNGMTRPDLSILLGSYDAEYQTALKKTPRQPGRRHVQSIRTDRIVVEQWGRMRSMQGRAYVPALVPQEVRIDEIK
jgi:hypothetical protein